MTEIFNKLAVIRVEMSEEDRVVHLLASLPKSYNTLVTALEASPDVPKMDIVTEKLLYQESKQKRSVKYPEEALPIHHRYSQRKQGPRCHFCHKIGHLQQNCIARAKSEKKREESAGKNPKHKANQVRSEMKSKSDSDSSTVGLVTRSLLSASTSDQSTDAWLIDSGATCHICNNRELFVQYEVFEKPQEVSVGNGYTLEATGSGIIALTLELPDHKQESANCRMYCTYLS